jgi:hypothetical protein
MTKPKTRNDPLSWLFPRFEHHRQPLAPRWLFVRRLAINVGIALVVVLASLGVGMVCYHTLEGLNWLQSFGHAAMILGGMGPYEEPINDSSKLFEGLYALYSGLLLVGVTGLILSPVFHRVMHQLHLPDDDEAAARSSGEAVAHGKTGKPKSKPRSKPKP